MNRVEYVECASIPDELIVSEFRIIPLVHEFSSKNWILASLASEQSILCYLKKRIALVSLINLGMDNFGKTHVLLSFDHGQLCDVVVVGSCLK